MRNDLALIVLDFETYMDKASGYCLGSKGLSVIEYIRDSRFKAHGLGYQAKESLPVWISGPNIQKWVSSIDWSNVAVCAHNVKFDGAILAWKYGVKPALWVDTKSMARAVIGTGISGFSLAEVAKYYGLQPKGEMKTDGVLVLSAEQEKELSAYCLNDVDLCLKILARLHSEFPVGQYELVDWSVRCFTEPQLVLDSSVLSKALSSEVDRRAKIFSESGFDKKVFSSNKKFSDLLTSAGYIVPTKISSRTSKNIPALSLNDPLFLDMLESGDEKLAKLCEARVAAKSNLLETRSKKLLGVSKSGLFPVDIQFSGAIQTHRFSGGGGFNFQNFSRKGPLRESVTVPKGKTLIVADASQIELRVVAWLAREARLIQPIKEGKDLYCDFGEKLYGRTITKADKAERQFSKCAVLGLGYNMGWEKFQKTVKLQTGETIDENRAKEVVKIYRTYYPKVQQLWYIMEKHLEYLAEKRNCRFYFAPFIRMEGGFVVLPSGLKLQYPGLRRSSEGEWVYTAHRQKRKEPENVNIYGGKLLENISQALAGEILKSSISRLLSVCAPVAFIHDELHFVVDDVQVDLAIEAVEEAMSASPLWWPDIKLATEVKAARNWAAAKAA